MSKFILCSIVALIWFFGALGYVVYPGELHDLSPKLEFPAKVCFYVPVIVFMIFAGYKWLSPAFKK